MSEQDVKGREQDARFVSDAWHSADKRKRVLLVRDVQVGAGRHLQQVGFILFRIVFVFIYSDSKRGS